jgi:hypothetical protein
VIDLIIPTCKARKDVLPLVDEIRAVTPGVRVSVTGFKVSAATNRNYGLNRAQSEIVLMCDDDMTGFFPGWDALLVKTLVENDAAVVSARLMTPEGKPGVMVGAEYDMDQPVVKVKARQLPTACICFRNDGTRFDEAFIGSGFEDNDFCLQLAMLYPERGFYISNEVKLVHINEMKNQKGKYWDANRAYFLRKWRVQE